MNQPPLLDQRERAGVRVHPPRRGIALLMVLIAVALVSLATLLPLRQQQTAAQREREAELLFVGEQYRRALASYAAATPGRVPQFPKALEELLEDKRFPTPRRHLRRLYPDPFTNALDWTVLREQGAIVGIASRSERTPFKRGGFNAAQHEFTSADRHADWKFVVAPGIVTADAGSAPLPPAGEPVAPLPAPPGAAPPSRPAPDADRRSACLRTFSQAISACLVDPATAAPCREQARTGFTACLRT